MGCRVGLWKLGLKQLQSVLTQLPFLQIWKLMMVIWCKMGFPLLCSPSPWRSRFNSPGTWLVRKEFPGGSNIQTKLGTTVWAQASRTPRIQSEEKAGWKGSWHSSFQELSFMSHWRCIQSFHWWSTGHCGRQDVVNQPSLQWNPQTSP